MDCELGLEFMSKTQKIWALILLLSSVSLLVASLPDRRTHVDDSWFAEQAYWLAKDGVVRSELFAGLHDYQDRQFVYHKLHIWQSAALIKVFGLNLYLLKSLPLIYFLVFIFVLYRYCREYFLDNSLEIFIFSLIFMISGGLFVEHVFINRPEVMIMCLGFISFLFIRKAIDRGVLLHSVLAGIFAGLAALTHLNGLIFILAGTAMLLIYKQYRLLFIFLLSAVVGFGFYFIEILDADSFSKFLYQFRHDPALTEKEFSPWLYVQKIFTEPVRYFNHSPEAIYSLLLFSVIIVRRKVIWADKEMRLVLVYLLWLMLFIAILTPGKKNYYLLYHMPYAVLLLAANLRGIFERWSGSNIAWASLLVLFFLVNFYDTVKTIIRGGVTPEVTEQVAAHFAIPAGSRVSAPIEFVFYQLGRVDLRCNGVHYIKARQSGDQMDKQKFFSAVKNDNREFLVLGSDAASKLLKHDLSQDEVVYGYRYLGQYEGFHAFQLN